MKIPSTKEYGKFLAEIKERIRSAQYEALKSVNKELIGLYWDIGKKIVEKQEHFGWGKSIVKNLAKDLQKEYSGIKGFSVQNLWYMRQFYLNYKNNAKLQPLVGEISWIKNILIMSKCKDSLEREFYITMTKKFGWTKNVLIHQIENNSYQKHMLNQTNFDKEYFLDLLLYHRKLKCLVAIDLKIGEFVPEFAGKMQFYLSVLDQKIKLKDENPSIGIIICKNRDKTIVEYALKETKKPIGVSTYRVTSSLPKNISQYLPSKEEISERIEDLRK